MGITLTIWKPDTGRVPAPLLRELVGRPDRPASPPPGAASSPWSWPSPSPSSCACCSTAPASASPCGPSSTTATWSGSTAPGPAWSAGRPWALGCMTAGIAGILIAPETGMVVENLTLIIIIALAAAVDRPAEEPAVGVRRRHDRRPGQGRSRRSSSAFSKDWTPTPTTPYRRSSSSSPCCSCPRPGSRPASLHLTRRTERLTKPWEAAVGALVMVGLVTSWANGWIPWFSGTHFGQRTRRVAGPGRRLHGDRADHAVPRAADRMGRPGAASPTSPSPASARSCSPTSAASTATRSGSSGSSAHLRPARAWPWPLPVLRLQGPLPGPGHHGASPSWPTGSCSATRP